MSESKPQQPDFSLLPEEQAIPFTEKEKWMASWSNYEGSGATITYIDKYGNKRVLQKPPVGARNADGWFIYFETGCIHSPNELMTSETRISHQRCIDQGISQYKI